MILLLFSAGALVPAESVTNDRLPDLVERHCVKCHGRDGKVKGDVNLREPGWVQQPELAHAVMEAVDSGEMPPDGETALGVEDRAFLITALKASVNIADEATWPRTPARRMNRFQYANAVKDLFDLRLEVFSLPEKMLRDYGYFRPETGKMPDQLRAGSRPLGKSQLIEKRLAGVAPFPQDLRAEHGFDNRGDHLTLSPLLMEAFFKLGQSIVNSVDFGPKTCGIWGDFFAPPQGDEDRVVRKRLRRLLIRAFRGPVDEATLDRYVQRVQSEIRAGTGFVAAMKTVASAVLCSPRFLYLYEGRPEPGYDLASRLSFLLWGSLPDDRLLQLAGQGRLNEDAVLASEVDRMMSDARLKRFCDSFPGQWLQLDRIITSVPDPERFPEFYFRPYRGSMHMMLEPLLLFETVLIENRSILELIDSDFSYRSDYLVEWYRSGRQRRRPPPTVIPFKRVPLESRREGGVITTAAVMTMTSNATRTQPITRGSWMATVIFNKPPEPPPADVPPLPEKPSAGEEMLTLRERLEAHRSRSDCAGCHARIDPLGFALENYGPTGLWRETYQNGRPVDSSGELFRRHRFSRIEEFKDAILEEKERFARAFAGHLLAFALGRAVEAVDEPSLRQAVSRTAKEDYRLRNLIRELVLSRSFRGAGVIASRGVER